jgi:hypothetical protein
MVTEIGWPSACPECQHRSVQAVLPYSSVDADISNCVSRLSSKATGKTSWEVV